jgi:hypothetical protein
MKPIPKVCRHCRQPLTPYWPLNWFAVALPALWLESTRVNVWSVTAIILLVGKLLHQLTLPWQWIAFVWLAPALLGSLGSLVVNLGPYAAAILIVIMKSLARRKE